MGDSIFMKRLFCASFFLFPLMKRECGHIYEDFVEVFFNGLLDSFFLCT
jgi:hypothetical protein